MTMNKHQNILSIKASSGELYYVARVGDEVTDRVGRVTGFKASYTSKNFTSESKAQEWVNKTMEAIENEIQI